MTEWVFEALMLIAFGCSWPASIAKSLRTKFVRGKSPAFMVIVLLGYVCGVIHKVLNPPPADAGVLAQHIVWLYLFVMALVLFELSLYVIYYHNTEPQNRK